MSRLTERCNAPQDLEAYLLARAKRGRGGRTASAAAAARPATAFGGMHAARRAMGIPDHQSAAPESPQADSVMAALHPNLSMHSTGTQSNPGSGRSLLGGLQASDVGLRASFDAGETLSANTSTDSNCLYGGSESRNLLRPHAPLSTDTPSAFYKDPVALAAAGAPPPPRGLPFNIPEASNESEMTQVRSARHACRLCDAIYARRLCSQAARVHWHLVQEVGNVTMP